MGKDLVPSSFAGKLGQDPVPVDTGHKYILNGSPKR